MASEEETRAAAEALESLQRADDPNRSPSGEDEYFQGPSLQDNIFQALARKKSQPRSAIQQPAADAPTNALVSVLITIVPAAKVLASDMSTLALKPGPPNLLKAATEVDKPMTCSRQQKPPGLCDVHSILKELPTNTRGQKPEPPTMDHTPAGGQPGSAMIAIHITTESDFATDTHQIILTTPEYSLPL